jgi:hypothetical protein
MNNLRKILGSQPKRQRQFGLLIMIAGIAGFIISMSYFALFGKQIEYNAIFISKAIIAFSFLVFGVYGVGYAVGGKQLGSSFAKRWAIFLIGAGVLGYLMRRFK